MYLCVALKVATLVLLQSMLCLETMVCKVTLDLVATSVALMFLFQPFWEAWCAHIACTLLPLCEVLCF